MNFNLYKLKEKKDIKIFILYLIKALNRPLSYNELNDVVVQDEIVDWFSCAESINELVDTGNLEISYNEEGELLYAITEQGCQVSKTLESEISSYIRENALRNALRYLQKEDIGNLRIINEKTEDGRIRLIFQYTTKEGDPMELSYIAQDEQQAESMQRTFRHDPYRIYLAITLILEGRFLRSINY